MGFAHLELEFLRVVLDLLHMLFSATISLILRFLGLLRQLFLVGQLGFRDISYCSLLVWRW
jgi:hypothetical protein